MLNVKNINYRYGNRGFKVGGLSLNVEPGYIYCLLGDNGCGKTTFLKLLYGMMTADSGEITWNNDTILSNGRITHKSLAKYHENAAFTGEKWCIDELSLEDNTKLLRSLYPSFDMEYFYKLISDSGLKQDMNKPYAELSKGQKVKAEIAFSLARKPKLLILDEPLANLDPVYKTEILETLQDAVAENEMSIIISTHLLDEVTDMVDYIIFMKNGEITRSGDRLTVLEREGKTELRELFAK
ncbi:MAG: ABC transporter ATP-binding protein [Eubacterium sp.]|nr:ABC transporter ATP-binding protein [Eubacterium sp.]